MRRTPATFYVRLALPPHLCTLGEVVRRVRFSSAAPVRFPPWPPDLQLERLLEPAFGRVAFVCGLVARSVSPLAMLG